jgi:hypothetical protein
MSNDIVKCVIGVENLKLRIATLQMFKWLDDVPYMSYTSKDSVNSVPKNSSSLFFGKKRSVFMPCLYGILNGVVSYAKCVHRKLQLPTRIVMKSFGNSFPIFLDCQTGASSKILITDNYSHI